MECGFVSVFLDFVCVCVSEHIFLFLSGNYPVVKWVGYVVCVYMYVCVYIHIYTYVAQIVKNLPMMQKTRI